MPRDRGVALTPGEVSELLDSQRTVTLATIGPGGLPHLAAMWFAPDGADLLMWTYRSSQKARNVQRDPRASLLGETGESYLELRGVCLDCRVELITDAAEVLAVGELLWTRNQRFEPGTGAVPQEHLRAQAAKRVGLRLHPVRTRGWDHRKLGSIDTAGRSRRG